MKVKELIEQLSKLPDDKNVYFYDDGCIDEINTTALTIPRYLNLSTVDLLKDNGDIVEEYEYDTCIYKEYEHDFDGLIKINPGNYQYCGQIVVISPHKNLQQIISDNQFEVDQKLPKQWQQEQDEEKQKEEREFQEFIRLSKKFVNRKVPKEDDSDKYREIRELFINKGDIPF